MIANSPDGFKYVGPYKDCLEHGQAEVTFARSSTLKSFVGQYSKGKSINGKWLYTSGDIYEGQFANGRMHGQGKFTSASGWGYEGGIVEGSWSG